MTSPGDDLLLRLAREHRWLGTTMDDLAARIADLEAGDRPAELGRLAVSLTTHLVVEDLVAHPLAAQVLTHGDEVVRDRLEEFDSLERHLAEAGGTADDTDQREADGGQGSSTWKVRRRPNRSDSAAQPGRPTALKIPATPTSTPAAPAPRR